MEIKGIIKAVFNKEGKYGILVDGQGEGWFTGFGTCPVNKGDNVSMNYEVNGNFKNIKNLVKIEEQAKIEAPVEKAIEVKKPEEPKPDQSVWDKKDKYARASMCVSYAKDLVVAGKLDLNKLRSEANGFLDTIEELANK